MGSHNILSLTIFILFFISAKGRSSLQKPQNLHLKVISRASSNDYTTNYTDVLSLGIFTSLYSELSDYADDPCVDPVWDWIECNSNSRPRVIALNLHSVFLYYDLPDFSSMDALQRIDFSDASLSGPIPSFLGTFPNLQELNLANNQFTGTVPASICNNKNLKLTIFGNSLLTTTCSTTTSNKSPSTPESISGGDGSIGGSGDGSSIGGSGSGSGSSIGGSGSGDGSQIPSTRSEKKSNTPKILGGVIPALVILGAVGGFAIHRHKAKTAAAVTQASAMHAGSTDPTAKMPTEEVPMNVHPNHMSPH